MFNQKAPTQENFGQQGYVRTVANASVDARLSFIRKVYLCLSATLIVCMGTIALSIKQDWALAMAQSGSLLMWLGLIVAMFAIYAVRKVPIVNVIALLGLGVFMGIYISPVVYMANMIQPGSNPFNGAVGQAFILTTCVFTGLTAYVFITRKDFSWMGGALFVGILLLIGVSFIGMFMGGFGEGFRLVYIIAGLVIFTGYTLYDTSMIIHHMSEDEYIAGALSLFLDFVYLFYYILMLVMDND